MIPNTQVGRVIKKAVSPYNIKTYGTLGSGGFEPSKAEPTDLQKPLNTPFSPHTLKGKISGQMLDF